MTRRIPRWLDRAVSWVGTLAILAFIWALTAGAAHLGRFLWVVLAVILVPIVGYLVFIGLVALSFLRQARRNREAAGKSAARPVAVRKRPRKSRGSR